MLLRNMFVGAFFFFLSFAFFLLYFNGSATDSSMQRCTHTIATIIILQFQSDRINAVTFGLTWLKATRCIIFFDAFACAQKLRHITVKVNLMERLYLTYLAKCLSIDFFLKRQCGWWFSEENETKLSISESVR